MSARRIFCSLFAALLLPVLTVGWSGSKPVAGLLNARVEAAEDVAEHVQPSLIADCKAIIPGKKFRLGVYLKTDPGWHTYYRESGDAGMPTKITWELPASFKASELLWEMPHKLVDAGIVTYGYPDKSVIAADIQAPETLKAGEKLEFKARVKWLVCKDVCIPGSAELQLTLPVAADPAQAGPDNQDLFKDVNFNGPAAAIKEAGATAGAKKKSRRD